MSAELLNLAFNLLAVGVNRGLILSTVDDMEKAGKSPQEITEALKALRKNSEIEAQAAIDAMPS